MALVSLVVEFLQLTAFLFDPVIPWSEQNVVRTVVRATLLSFDQWPDLSVTLIWVSVGVGLVFVLGVGVVAKFPTLPTLTLTTLAYVLPILGKLGFLPIVRTLLSSFACGSSISPPIPDPVLISDPRVVCWEGSHWAMAILSGVTFVLYTPLAIKWSPMWQLLSSETLQIHWRGSYIVAAVSFKAILAVTTVFLRSNWVIVGASGVVLLVQLTLGLVLKRACSKAVVGRLRTMFLSLALITLIASIVAIVAGDADQAASIIVYVSWPVLIFGWFLLEKSRDGQQGKAGRFKAALQAKSTDHKDQELGIVTGQKSLTVEDVSAKLSSDPKLEKFAEAFAKEGIDGEVLGAMSKEDLKENFGLNVGEIVLLRRLFAE